MLTRIFLVLTCALLATNGPAAAATLTAEVLDQNGHPVANAVVSLVPAGNAILPAAASRLPLRQVIDQRDETFIPLVTILPRDGHLIFTNNDHTTHQVYSFSAIKQFEFILPRGQVSLPVRFDKPGVAAIGCNIHDHMIAYVYVAESPWTALSGADGRVQIADVPAGSYRAQIWHPQLAPGSEIPSVSVDVGAGPARFSINLSLAGQMPRSMRGMHGGDY